MGYFSKTIKNYGIIENLNLQSSEHLRMDVSGEVVEKSPKTKCEDVSGW